MLYTEMHAMRESCDKYNLDVELGFSGVDAILGKCCTQIIHG